MKFSSKLAILGVVAGLSATSAVIAEEAAPVVANPPEETVVDEPTADPSDKETPPADEEVTEPETPGDDEVVVEDGGEVPIDWVKRGGDGENPDVIFYNMAGGGPQENGGQGHGAAPAETGKDESATTTEAKTVAPAAPIVREKKGPVALVKGARVFLRH